MKRKLEYMLIHDIHDTLSVGQAFGRFPLHLTVVPWFALSEDASEESTVSSISQFTQDLAPMTFVGAKRDKFGPDLDIPVTMLEKTDSLTRLHVGLIAVSGVTVDSQFIGINDYHPHISDTDDDRFEVGQEQSLGELTLVRRTDSSSNRKVVARLTLGAGELV
ncbi:hypothetical protein KA021_02980 [Candidatus Saccharibacteria bacterium]|jgi:hypothetical protein|nr:hypothetical protein [Candidatus Saccharibacteria bacterium]